jgi:hypothetical protein
MACIHEPSRDVPIGGEVDVVVCGAGPAGIGAALGAARSGARTLLIEANGCLGGTWTAGLLCWIIDSHGKPGVMAEIANRLAEADARRFRVPDGKSYTYDAEVMKVLLEELCVGAGVDVLLHTRAAACHLEGDRLDAVVTESKSGREAWRAAAFVDATGDGDLGALAGCSVDIGHPDTGRCQPMSMACLVTGIRFDDVEPFTGGGMSVHKQRFLKEIQDAGVDPSYHPPVLMVIRDDLFVMIPNHQYGASAMSANDVTRATIEGRREIHTIVNALRAKGGVWKDMRVVATGEHIGIREGRRIRGLYTVTLDDMIAGVEHEDAICRVTFGIDVHSTDRAKTRGFERPEGVRTKPYDIPFRSLVARDVTGLLMAGRCISGDFFAHSSYRVTGNAVPMGEAAGVAAALCAQRGCAPGDLPWDALRNGLEAIRSR